MRKPIAVSLLVVSLLFSGCAVQKSKAPQISPATANALNFGTLVSESQADYVNFFQTVGQLEKAGALTAAQVSTLNDAGLKMRDALDSAGNLAQTFAATNNQTIAAEIQGFLTTAAQVYAQIYAERAAMQTANARAKASTSP
jgi:hypothetical protein